jgi:mono/diheme cytochrome c family protein
MIGSLTWADPATNTTSAKDPGRAAQGRALFNGKGICSTCHGVDGDRNRLPRHLTPNVRENIAGLDPKPPDLRHAGSLTLTTDKQRFASIRHGHLRSSMQPLSREVLSDDDIVSILAYLASIRGTVPPAAPVPEGDSVPRGDAGSGRQVYHEIGGCAICHGIEGHLNQRPPISPDLAQRLARLPVPPANLRKPAGLKSKNDEDRFRSIKFGHPGTAMFPKHLLRDDDIRDVVAYLGTLGPNKP